MGQYLRRRLLLLIPVFFGITLLNFILINLMPGDAIDAMISPRQMQSMSPAELQARRVALGLDQPLPVRYVLWLNEFVHGNLGYDFRTSEPVAAELGSLLVSTLRLQLVAFVIAVA